MLWNATIYVNYPKEWGTKFKEMPDSYTCVIQEHLYKDTQYPNQCEQIGLCVDLGQMTKHMSSGSKCRLGQRMGTLTCFIWTQEMRIQTNVNSFPHQKACHMMNYMGHEHVSILLKKWWKSKPFWTVWTPILKSRQMMKPMGRGSMCQLGKRMGNLVGSQEGGAPHLLCLLNGNRAMPLNCCSQLEAILLGMQL